MENSFPDLEGEEYEVPRVTESIMNKMILNYLIIEGYKGAAIKFAKETGMEATIDDLIEQRLQIWKLIQEGSIDAAMVMINDINPAIIGESDQLKFDLNK